MNTRRTETEKELDKLLAEIAEEEDREPSPEFYARRKERLARWKKELEEEAALGKDKPNKQVKTESRRREIGPQMKAILSLAAVFVFLICGTFLTRGSLRGTNTPGTPGGQITVVENPGNTPAIDGSGIIDTTEVKAPEGFAGFMQDMWLFIKAAFPYLCAVAAVVLVIVIVRKKMKSKE